MCRLTIVALTLVLSAAPSASGDETDEGPRRPAPRPERRRGGDFGPGLGTRVPDVSAHDEAGKRISLRELFRGRYSVVVFGCLT